MAQDTEPLIRLEPGGRAPILSYDLPEPAVYFGRNFIELDYDDVAVFGGTVDVVLESAGDRLIDVIKAVRQVAGLGLKEAKDLVEAAPRTVLRDVGGQDAERARVALEAAGATVRVGSGGVAEMEEELEDSFSEEELATVVEEGMRAGFADGRLFPQVRLSAGSLRLTPKPDGGLDVVSTVPVSPQLAMLDVEEIASRKASGQELSIYTSMFGTLRHRYVPRHRTTRPRIMLVETYRLATYLGAYGAGPVIQTFSLLPGERTTIGIRTFRKTEEERSEASSILDSFTESSATDFEETVASEQANRSTYEESFAYHAEAEAKASWGWGRARVSGGVKGSSNAAREEAAKNTTNATNKHAQKASAKRQIEVDTSFERRETEEEERTTEREIENINVSRTLNFVFRQMNQEYITVLSLVDVRVAYFDGRAASRDEVTLPELDGLLERHVAESERARVRSDVRETLENVLDFRGERHADLVEEREVDADTRYLRVRTEKTSVYRDPVSDTTIEVPGVILSVTKNVMRTDGVIVEALLGVGEALDDYSARLQELEVERRRAEAAKEQALAEQAVLANDVIRENDEDRAELLERLMGGVPLDAPLEIAIRPRGSSDDGSSGGRD